jgi:transposase
MAGELYIGIDVSKDSLEVAFGGDGQVRQVANADRAIMALAAELKELGPKLVVMEASGGYERIAAGLLWEAELPVVIANPNQVRDFAKGMGQYAKTDRQDARIIARWAEVKQPPVRQLPDAQGRELSELLARRRQLLEMLVAERQRLAQTVSKPIRKELNASIGSLERRLARIEAEIEQRIRKSDLWNRTRELLESVPGVGKLTSFTLLAELPELGTSDRRHLASLVGVAPYPRDSGKWHRPRLTHGGRAAVRSALYMAALSAARFNPVLEPFYQRLLSRGAAKKKAFVAVVRRLLGILNAIVRDRTPWRSPCAVPTT